jgi:hypothetical protein
MALQMRTQQLAGSRVVAASRTVPFRPAAAARRSSVAVRAASSTSSDNLGFELMRDGVKKATAESLLTPRFYTTGAQARVRSQAACALSV